MERAPNQSEVARLLRQIETEYTAAQNGLIGLAAGAHHEAITARMENLGRLHQGLRALVGDEATKLFAECLEGIPTE